MSQPLFGVQSSVGNFSQGVQQMLDFARNNMNRTPAAAQPAAADDLATLIAAGAAEPPAQAVAAVDDAAARTPSLLDRLRGGMPALDQLRARPTVAAASPVVEAAEAGAEVVTKQAASLGDQLLQGLRQAARYATTVR